MVPSYASPEKNDRFVFPKSGYRFFYVIVIVKQGFHFGDRKKRWVPPSGLKEEFVCICGSI